MSFEKHRNGLRGWFTMAGDGRRQFGGTDSYEIPPGVSLHRCVQGSDWLTIAGSPSATDMLQMHPRQGAAQHLYSSTASFNLPISAKTLLFIARGQLGGVFRVVSSPEQDLDSAKVDIVVRHERFQLRDEVRVCLLNREVSEYGVGVFVDKNLLFESPIKFEMTVILPETSSPMVEIQNFETDLPNTAHLFGDFNGKVFFNSVSLRGSNGGVDAQSLTAGKTQVRISNGEIRGSFNVADELDLETHNAPIHINVGLKSVEGKTDPKFRVLTSNRILEANVSLLSSSGSGGYFNIEAKTVNAPLHLNFPVSPLNSSLNLNAVTSNGKATVSLDSAYEGSFLLDTSSPLFRSTVKPTVQGSTDPAGRQRKRKVQYELSGKRSLTMGTIYWDGDATNVGALDGRVTNRGFGQVEVYTANAEVNLEV